MLSEVRSMLIGKRSNKAVTTAFTKITATMNNTVKPVAKEPYFNLRLFKGFLAFFSPEYEEMRFIFIKAPP